MDIHFQERFRGRNFIINKFKMFLFLLLLFLLVKKTNFET